MGYYATYSAEITIRKPFDKDEIEHAIMSVFPDCWGLDELSSETDSNHVALLIFSGYSKYWDEDVCDLLKWLSPYVVSGRIEYSGDDEEFWRHVFVNGKWVVQRGYIAYEEHGKEI